MKRLYETMVVYDGTLSEDLLNKEKEKVKAFLTESCEFEKLDDWGRRELAYLIGKKRVGHYSLFLYAGGDGTTCAKLDKMLRANERVLRFLSVKRAPVKKVSEQEAAQPQAAA